MRDRQQETDAGEDRQQMQTYKKTTEWQIRMALQICAHGRAVRKCHQPAMPSILSTSATWILFQVRISAHFCSSISLCSLRHFLLLSSLLCHDLSSACSFFIRFIPAAFYHFRHQTNISQRKSKKLRDGVWRIDFRFGCFVPVWLSLLDILFVHCINQLFPHTHFDMTS